MRRSEFIRELRQFSRIGPAEFQFAPIREIRGYCFLPFLSVSVGVHPWLLFLPPGCAMNRSIPRPYSLLAEITHRCPLHCPYCSNPLQLASPAKELTTEEWK